MKLQMQHCFMYVQLVPAALCRRLAKLKLLTAKCELPWCCGVVCMQVQGHRHAAGLPDGPLHCHPPQGDTQHPRLLRPHHAQVGRLHCLLMSAVITASGRTKQQKQKRHSDVPLPQVAVSRAATAVLTASASGVALIAGSIDLHDMFCWTGVTVVVVAHTFTPPPCLASCSDHGTIVHTGDWKIDEDPVDGQVFDRTTFDLLSEFACT
jgi:hypothetical protein